MTGRDLIIYILANGLEDEPVFKDGTFIGFLPEEKFAAKCNVGISTVRTWANIGMIDAIKTCSSVYIPEQQMKEVKVNG